MHMLVLLSPAVVLANVSYPFFRQGDPHGCGVQSYELVCTATNATIRIGSGTYKVLSINYSDSTFWVVDANLDMQSSCPLPPWDYRPHYGYGRRRRSIIVELETRGYWVTFANCSQETKYNGIWHPVKCLSTTDFFIYMAIGNLDEAESFEPSCGYLARTPLGGPGMMLPVPKNASYPDVKFTREGFTLRFPYLIGGDFRKCLAESKR